MFPISRTLWTSLDGLPVGEMDCAVMMPITSLGLRFSSKMSLSIRSPESDSSSALKEIRMLLSLEYCSIFCLRSSSSGGIAIFAGLVAAGAGQPEVAPSETPGNASVAIKMSAAPDAIAADSLGVMSLPRFRQSNAWRQVIGIWARAGSHGRSKAPTTQARHPVTGMSPRPLGATPVHRCQHRSRAHPCPPRLLPPRPMACPR